MFELSTLQVQAKGLAKCKKKFLRTVFFIMIITH